MDFNQILDVLKDKTYPSQLGFGDVSAQNCRHFGLGQIAEVHNKTEGDEYNTTKTVVYHFVDHNIYVKVVGYSDSYSYGHYDYDITQTFPETVMITKFN